MMRLKIDYTKCTKAGQCYYMHPELVKRGTRDLPQLLLEDVGEDALDDAESLVDICPSAAITLED